MRTYNFIGFDGGINVNPGGLDVKGDGVKYYYTVDNDDLDLESHSFFHISTLEVEITIPGGASEEEAEVLIKGSLTIPEPGESPEYAGKIGLKVKSLGINAEVSMRYAPKYPAYMVTAKVGLNKPIPLGPISLTAFNGLIGYRYVAEKEAIGMTSKDTWYDYYLAPQRGINEDKFSGPERTKDYDFPFSLGIGATFEATGAPKIVSLRAMVLLSLPKMFAVDAGLNILTKRLGLAETDESEANFFAFIIFGDNSLEFGAGADYKLNKNGWFIDLHAEIQAGFFFKNQRPWYINFGTREKPVSAVLFKDFLDLKSQAFLMISGKGIEAGARAEFKLQLGKFAKAWAIVEVGGKISFEKPQVGGYLYLEGGIDVNFRVIRITAVLSVYLSVELIKPFKIFAELKFTFKIKIVFIKIKIKVKLTLKWEKSNKVDRAPIPAITFNKPSNDIDYYKPTTHLEAVQGVHMMTQEVFDIDYIPIVSSNLKTDEEQVSDYFNKKLDEIKVIPLDTYIDFKSEKALFPSKNLDAIIGGHTGIAADFIELIPPEKTVKGGHTIRQVKHKYIIEDIEIKALTTNGWVDYHPFKALSPNANIAGIDLTKLKIGHWQRKNERYDSIRLLASNPFSFLDGASPGWFVPEQYGITPSEIFCESTFTSEHVSNFENLPIGTTYYPPAHYPAHFINGAYYNIKGDYYQSFEMDEDGNIKEVVSEDVMKVDFLPSSSVKSLEFSNANTLVITLPQDSVCMKIKLSSYIDAVNITCKKPMIDDKSGTVISYDDIVFGTYSSSQILNDEIKLEAPKLSNGDYDLSKAFTIIEITPQASNLADIEAVKAEMNAIVEYADLNTNGEITGAHFDRYEDLELQLSNLKKNLCAGINISNNNTLQSKTTIVPENTLLQACVELDVISHGFGIVSSSLGLSVNEIALVNSQTELNSIYSTFIVEQGETYTVPQIDFLNKSVILISNQNNINDTNSISTIHLDKIVRRNNEVNICYSFYGHVFGEGTIVNPRIFVFETDKISDGAVLHSNENCNCSGNETENCKKIDFEVIGEGYEKYTYNDKILVRDEVTFNSIKQRMVNYRIYPEFSSLVNFDDYSLILINITGFGGTKGDISVPVVYKVFELNNSIGVCYDEKQETTIFDAYGNEYYKTIIVKIPKVSADKGLLVSNTHCDCQEASNYELCRNLAFRTLMNSLDCLHENYFAKVINNQTEFNNEYMGLGMSGL